MSRKAASRTSVHDVVLLPCPFCGSTELNGPHISEYVGDHYSPSWWVDCEECPGGIEVQGADVSGLEEAWNKRVDREDAESYRAMMAAFARPDQMRNDVAPVWDSRNVGQ